MLVLLSCYANTFGPGGFGEIELLLAISLFVVPLAAAQVSDAFLPAYAKDPAVAVSNACTVAIVGMLLVLVLAGIASGYEAALGAAWMALGAHAVSTIGWNLARSVMRAAGRFSASARCEMLSSLASLCVGVGLLFTETIGAEGALLAIAVGNCIAIIQGRALAKDVFQEARTGLVAAGPLRHILSISSRLAPNFVLWWGIELSDRFILAYYLGEQAVGIYASAARFAGIVMAVMLVLYQVWQPEAVRSTRDMQGQAFLERTFMLFVSPVVLGASALMASATWVVPRLFGEEFAGAIPYVGLMAPAFVLASLAYFFGITFYSGPARGTSRASVVGLVVSVGINVALVPRYGPVVAAFSALVAYASICLVRYLDFRRRWTLRHNKPRLLSLAALISVQSAALFLEAGWEWQAAALVLVLLTSLKELGRVSRTFTWNR